MRNSNRSRAQRLFDALVAPLALSFCLILSPIAEADQHNEKPQGREQLERELEAARAVPGQGDLVADVVHAVEGNGAHRRADRAGLHRQPP